MGIFFNWVEDRVECPPPDSAVNGLVKTSLILWAHTHTLLHLGDPRFSLQPTQKDLEPTESNLLLHIVPDHGGKGWTL